jgi:hypothetical protein
MAGAAAFSALFDRTAVTAVTRRALLFFTDAVRLN